MAEVENAPPILRIVALNLPRRSPLTDFPGAYQGGPGFSETSLKYTATATAMTAS